MLFPYLTYTHTHTKKDNNSHLPRGAALVYRIALYHRDLVTHLFAVCVPYIPPMPQYISHEDLVRTRLPNFAYQLQFKSGEVEKAVKTKEEIKQFLLALYGGRTEDGQWGFSTEKGILFDRLGKLGSSKLLEDEVCICGCITTLRGASEFFFFFFWLFFYWSFANYVSKELNYYVDEFSRNGIHGPCKLQVFFPSSPYHITFPILRFDF